MDHQSEALKAYIGLLRTSSQLEQIAKQDVACYNLNITEFSVLELLFHKGAHTTQGIKEKILIASSSTTYVIDQLVKKRTCSKTK
jgi:MarR family 2-MHQ and catechol resistance regulon transcriptional repressor